VGFALPKSIAARLPACGRCIALKKKGRPKAALLLARIAGLTKGPLPAGGCAKLVDVVAPVWLFTFEMARAAARDRFGSAGIR
jgi:hypothetical protein